LRHIISSNRVATNPKKPTVIQDWPLPHTIKELKGFLGLAGYYKKFIKNFRIVSKPLTHLLKNNSFEWNVLAKTTFDRLKKALCMAPVLALPDSKKVFVLETDVCTNGVGVMLSQKGRPLAFFSKALSSKHLGLSIYKKKNMAILMVVER
jgi:hypothetical protein